MAGLAIGAILGGVGQVFGAAGRRERQESEAEFDIQNRQRERVFQEMQFNPFAPAERARRGRIYGALAKAWGLDKILGDKYINFISDYSNVPGTEGIGGAPNLASADVTGVDKGKLEGNKLGLFGDILGATSGALGGGFGGGDPFRSSSLGQVPRFDRDFNTGSLPGVR